MAIEESAVIVRIDLKKREGQVPTHPVDGLPHRLLSTVREDLELTPPGIHIHGGQGVEVFALGALPAVSHKVHLQESRSGLVPVHERPHRDLVVKKGPGLGGRAPPQGLWAVGTKQAIDGSWAQLKEKPLRLRPYPQLSMALENGHDLRKARG
ncbi:MAG: hypothetical protein QXI12_02315 [Candidatus Methanomethyliaceae archaeon]